MDVLSAFTSLLHTFKGVNRLCAKPLNQWPIYASTLQKIKLEDGKRVYQLQVLSNYDQAKNYYNTHYQEHCKSVNNCLLKSRLAWSDLQFIHDVILVLATYGWEILEGNDSESENGSSMEVIVKLGERFQIPLESARVDIHVY